jgi:DnaK suppressor protein
MSTNSLTPQQIEQLRQLLVAQQSELENLLNSVHSGTQTVTLDQQSVGRISRIDALQQQQMAIANQQQASAQLRSIEQALRRIDADNDYGLCAECGETIAYARLQAQPNASLCIGCQSASESK